MIVSTSVRRVKRSRGKPEWNPAPLIPVETHSRTGLRVQSPLKKDPTAEPVVKARQTASNLRDPRIPASSRSGNFSRKSTTRRPSAAAHSSPRLSAVSANVKSVSEARPSKSTITNSLSTLNKRISSVSNIVGKASPPISVRERLQDEFEREVEYFELERSQVLENSENIHPHNDILTGKEEDSLRLLASIKDTVERTVKNSSALNRKEKSPLTPTILNAPERQDFIPDHPAFMNDYVASSATDVSDSVSTRPGHRDVTGVPRLKEEAGLDLRASAVKSDLNIPSISAKPVASNEPYNLEDMADSLARIFTAKVGSMLTPLNQQKAVLDSIRQSMGQERAQLAAEKVSEVEDEQDDAAIVFPEPPPGFGKLPPAVTGSEDETPEEEDDDEDKVLVINSERHPVISAQLPTRQPQRPRKLILSDETVKRIAKDRARRMSSRRLEFQASTPMDREALDKFLDRQFWQVLDSIAREKARKVVKSCLDEVEGVVNSVVEDVYQREVK
ncbi:MAG: hypothetical protein SGCHY_000230 [Lobulomycetales sp.]